jgi:GxxExxY protein
MKHAELTERIIKAFYHVYNALGPGFLEKVYERALELELKEMGLHVRHQAPIEVYYKGVQVGEYFADLLVEESVILEIKAVEKLADEHGAQLVNYLKATRIEVGLLLNFGPRPEVKRKVFETARKSPSSNQSLSLPDPR